MLHGEEERISVARLERATVLHVAANKSGDPDDWEVAADAWEEYGGEHDLEAAFCRGMAKALRAKVPEYLYPILYRRKGDLPPSAEAAVVSCGRHILSGSPDSGYRVLSESRISLPISGAEP